MISPYISFAFLVSILILKLLGDEVIENIMLLRVDGIIVAILVLIISAMITDFILTRFIEVV